MWVASYLHFLYTMNATRIYAISATSSFSFSNIMQAYRAIQVNQHKNMFKHFSCERKLRRKAGAILASVRPSSQCLSSHKVWAVYKTRSISLCILPAFSLGSCYILRQCWRPFISIVRAPYTVTVIWCYKVQNFKMQRNKRLVVFPWMGM
jgi:hypothetical protein